MLERAELDRRAEAIEAALKGIEVASTGGQPASAQRLRGWLDSYRMRPRDNAHSQSGEE